MAKKSFEITEFDVFFLSYDEPNADKHWADLIENAPWADRVHGVKGFDAAHRACAEKSNTDWFVTVDADNIVAPDFFSLKVDLDPEARPNQCLSWNGVNMLNGLQYGNGGVKLWSKQFVLTMDSHENATDPRKAVDFCWEDDYQQVYKTYSQVWPNGSPYQAYRAGFREGIKLALDRGERIAPEAMNATLHPINLRNLRIWACVGADQPNGLWANYGARNGWSAMCELAWDHVAVRDYDWFKTHWTETLDGMGFDEKAAVAAGRADRPSLERAALIDRATALGAFLKAKTGMVVPMFDSETSEFFRDTFKLRNE